MVKDQQSLKGYNLKMVLNAVRFSEGVSKKQTKELTKLSFASLTRIFTSLELMDLVKLKEIHSTGKKGRNTSIYKINKEALYCLGISISKKEITVYIMNFAGEIEYSISEKPCFRVAKAKDIINQVYEMFNRVMKEVDVPKSKILVGGISLSGAIDRQNKTVLFCPDFKWTDEDIGKMFEEKFKMPVVVENDVKSFLIGEREKYFYKAQDVCYIKIEDSLEASFISGNQILDGFENMAGQIGHIQSYDGIDVCDCGKVGCINSQLNSKNIIKKAKEFSSEVTNLDEVMMAYKIKYKWSFELINQIVENSALALNIISCILNPEIIVVGGEYVNRYPFLFDEILKKFHQISYKVASKNSNICKSKSSQVIGIGILAQSYIIDKIFSQ